MHTIKHTIKILTNGKDHNAFHIWKSVSDQVKFEKPKSVHQIISSMRADL